MTSTLPGRADALRPVEAVPDAPDAPGGEAVAGSWARRLAPAYSAFVVAATVTGLVVRFCSSGPLWLDEALTVNIAKLPLGQLRGALRVDGSPPLYYYLLHAWIAVFGQGTHAVRAFSGVVSVLALVPLWFLARRLGGPVLAQSAVVLLATAPFALRFGSETRMYSLVLLEVCLGGLALSRALERPTLRRLAPVTVAVLVLALTHYWTLFLLVTAALGLVVTRRWRVLGAFVAAGILFAPQLPTLLFQVSHTGTPWAAPTMPRAVIDTLLNWGGPPGYALAPLLGALFIGVAALGALAWRSETGQLVLEPRRTRLGVALAGLSVGPLVVAAALTMVAGAGFVERYTAIAVPAFVLLVALGLSLVGPAARVALVVVMAVVGLTTGTSDAVHLRTQAGDVAAAIGATTKPGDLVVYCPDQLAPAVHRVIPPGRVEVSYGDFLGPERVDWVDYKQRNATLDPIAAAEAYDDMAGPGHSISLVYAEGYRTLGGQCSTLAEQLDALRPGAVTWVTRDTGKGESSSDRVFPGLDASTLGSPPDPPVG